MRTALPPFVLRAAKKNGQKHIAKQTAFIGQQGRQPRREKGEDCLSGASSAAPERGVGVRATSPITAAALLGSFFSLQRRMNKNILRSKTAFIGQQGRQPRREKGEDCLSGASSAAHERGVGVRANSPITAAALSPFVLLAAEKNEQKTYCEANRIYRAARTAAEEKNAISTE